MHSNATIATAFASTIMLSSSAWAAGVECNWFTRAFYKCETWTQGPPLPGEERPREPYNGPVPKFDEPAPAPSSPGGIWNAARFWDKLGDVLNRNQPEVRGAPLPGEAEAQRGRPVGVQGTALPKLEDIPTVFRSIEGQKALAGGAGAPAAGAGRDTFGLEALERQRPGSLPPMASSTVPQSPQMAAGPPPNYEMYGSGPKYLPPIAADRSAAGFFDPLYNDGERKPDWRQHLGIDLTGKSGAGVTAPVSGTVVGYYPNKKDPNYSFLVIQEKGSRTQHVVGHIHSNLKAGDEVVVGKTTVGTVVKDHVHWGANSAGIPITPDKDGFGWGRAPISASQSEAVKKGWINLDSYRPKTNVPSSNQASSTPARQPQGLPAEKPASTVPIAKPQSLAVSRYIPPSGHTFAAPNAQPVSLVVPYRRPGGILLSKAAAERMALDLDIDGMHYAEGTVVLTGRQSRNSIDAALFLTSMRLACTGNDPSFSLDPPDPAAWSDQTEQAMDAVWQHVKQRFERQDGRSGTTTISARRDLADFWQRIAPRYPALKSELVFRPAWLKQTRLGEILYKADVLLKELSVGASVVQPDLPFRGGAIGGFVSAAQDSVERGLRQERGWGGRSGNRLWFDLLPKGDRVGEAQKVAIHANAGSIDLSVIHPKMFVRRHERGEDVAGTSPSLDRLSNDVNRRTAMYAAAYQELKSLTDVFRGYVAAVKLVEQHKSVCRQISSLPLGEGEKVGQPMPDYHPAELFLTVAKRNIGAGWRLVSHSSVNGGIAVRGRALLTAGVVSAPTPLMKELEQEVAGGIREARWQSNGRQYVALDLERREPPPRAPVAAPVGR